MFNLVFLIETSFCYKLECDDHSATDTFIIFNRDGIMLLGQSKKRLKVLPECVFFQIYFKRLH